jgi:hypothetical protein
LRLYSPPFLCSAYPWSHVNVIVLASNVDGRFADVAAILDSTDDQYEFYSVQHSVILEFVHDIHEHALSRTSNIEGTTAAIPH